MTTPCDGLLYKPTKAPFNNNNRPGAPEGPYEANLDRLVGGNPNGDWKLYVFDDWQGGIPGRIASGWSLTIETAVPDAEVPAVSHLAGPANNYPLIQRAGQGAPRRRAPDRGTANGSTNGQAAPA